LKLLVETLFESPRPYKFLDPFGPADKRLFYGRDQDLQTLREMLTETQPKLPVILYGASGTGKTSLLQAGLLPELRTGGHAAVFVRMGDDEPTAAIKAALVRECNLDPGIQEQPLLDGVQAATTAPGRTVVVILDQFEEFFGSMGWRSASDCARS
jgi:Cdc6-like AAA superfamily ATPase